MMNRITQETAAQLLPLRPDDGHKGTFGHTFLLAGSRRYPGAMRLACEGAGRSGAGLVTAGIPQTLIGVAAVTLMESMGLALPDTSTGALGRDAIEPAMDFAQDKDSVVLGPGLGADEETLDFVLACVPRITAPLVVDADGLNLVAKNVLCLLPRPMGSTIVTPHPGEMARLTGLSTKDIQSQREHVAATFAKTHRVIVVLKGYETVVAHPDGRIAVNTTGNSGMGTGGTGDILAGLLGGLLAQGMEPWDAARLGVWLHGYAGDIAAQEFTARAMIARDVIASLPKAFATLEATL